jgi:pimeloyl-ACP methyl ester carboxylesterase
MYSSDTLALLRATERGSDLSAAAIYPASFASSSFMRQDAAGEPYLLHTNGKPNKIILFLHSWSGDLNQVKGIPEIYNIENSCIIAPNFGGYNNTAGALGSQDITDRIARVVSEVRYKTGLTRVYLVGGSGGGMASLLLLGRYPDLVHRASIWVPIYDLASLYATTSNQNLKTDMITVLGSAPTGADDARYLARSPRSCLQNFNGRPIVIINVGTSDLEVPKINGENARAAMLSAAPDADVRLVEWAMGHEFKALEAVKQLVLE